MTKEPVGNSVLNPSRRGFAAMGVIAAAWSGSAVAAPLANSIKPQKTGSLKVKVDGNLFRPEVGEHPGLVMFASAAAAHSANAAVAHQLASQGWAVLLVETDVIGGSANMTREARRHVEWLVAQKGVAAADPASAGAHDVCHGFTLRSFSAARPSLSLANREQRRAAAASSVLFAAPAVLLTKAEGRREGLNSAVRALYSLAA